MKEVYHVKGPFWSNCFIEALKNKIKHPAKIKITFVPKSEAGCWHFLWSDGIWDYDFGVEKELKGLEILWFKGYVRQRKLGFNEKYKSMMKNRWKNKNRLN